MLHICSRLKLCLLQFLFPSNAATCRVFVKVKRRLIETDRCCWRSNETRTPPRFAHYQVPDDLTFLKKIQSGSSSYVNLSLCNRSLRPRNSFASACVTRQECVVELVAADFCVMPGDGWGSRQQRPDMLQHKNHPSVLTQVFNRRILM